MSKSCKVFQGVLVLVGLATAATFLIASVVRGLDPLSAIAAFVALASVKFIVR